MIEISRNYFKPRYGASINEKKMIINSFVWLLAIVILITIVVIVCVNWQDIMLHIHQYLQPTTPVPTKTVIVEGWLAEFDYLVIEAAYIIKRENIQLVLVTDLIRDELSQSTGKITAQRLAELGIDQNKIRLVSAPIVKYGNTRQAAKALRSYVIESQTDVSSANIITGGTHGRKTLIIFRTILGAELQLGIISLPMEHAPWGKWYRTKRGNLGTIKYLIGYVLTMIFRR